MDTPLEQLQKQAEELFEKKQYNELIELLSGDVLEQYKDAVLYAWRARAHNRLNQFDISLVYSDKAIKADGSYFMGFFARGYSLADKGEHDKAIADYTEAIELKNDDIVAHNNRGISWENKGEFENAITDFSKAIQLKNDYALAYKNRGRIYEKQAKLQEAKQDYENAVKYNPKDFYAKSLLDKLLAKLGEPIPEAKEESTDDSFYKIKDVVKELTEREQADILQLYQSKIDPKIKDIRKLAINTEQVWKDALKDKYTDAAPKLVAHYSSLKTADILIMKNKGKDKETGEEIVSKMRYSNAVFMNDPEEGRVLIEYLDKLEKGSKGTAEIKTAFENALKEEKTNFYLGSFLPMIKNHEDELLMWRTYGKDENMNEAAGCCILLDIDFFDEHDGGHMALGREGETPKVSHPLYKVLYYDQRDGEFVGTDKEDIKKLIAKLKSDLKKLLRKKVKRKRELYEDEIKYNNAIDKVLYHSLSELRYFFKSSDYSYENELRVIQFATHADVVKIDEAGGVPRKMYIESTKDIKPYLRKIVLGPKVQHPERWMYLAEKMRRDEYLNFEIAYSTCHFR